MFSFIRRSWLWLSFSGVLLAISIGAIALFGLNFGIDFTGGSLMTVTFDTPTTPTKIVETLTTIPDVEIQNPVVAPTETAGRYILRFRYLEDEAEQQAIDAALRKNIGTFALESITTVGPTLGTSLREKALRALSYASLAIILYLAATFRDTRRDSVTKYALVGTLVASLAIISEVMVSDDQTRWLIWAANLGVFLFFLISEIRKKNPSLKYGVCAVLALIHDLLITIGVFALLGHFFGVEIDALFVTALLTIMGFSVHDTIVVFDRMRENLKYQRGGESLAMTADKSLNQTLVRSINTSLSTLITLAALFFLGAESIRWFVAALLVGIAIGTYSSIFTATPLFVLWQSRAGRRE